MVAGLARPRDGVEDPPAGSGADVECSDMARGGGARAFTDLGSHDQEVTVNDPGVLDLRWREETSWSSPSRMSMAPSLPKLGTGRPVAGQAHRGRARLKKRGASRPPAPEYRKTAVDTGPSGRRHELPDFLSGCRFERENLERRRGQIDHVADHKRIALDGREPAGDFRRAGRPNGLQLSDVRTVDLAQLGKLRAGQIPAIHGPLTRGTAVPHKRREKAVRETPGSNSSVHGRNRRQSGEVRSGTTCFVVVRSAPSKILGSGYRSVKQPGVGGGWGRCSTTAGKSESPDHPARFELRAGTSGDWRIQQPNFPTRERWALSQE